VNNQGPELSPEARRIISDARGVDDPTAEDRTRVKTRWLASVAAVVGVSSLTEAARAAGGIGWGLKAAGAALVLAAGAIAVYFTVPNVTVPNVTAPTDVTRDPAGRDPAKRPEGPAWSGTTHGRFEKTPAGERHALEHTTSYGSEQRSVGEGASTSAVPAPSSAPELTPAVPLISAPPVHVPVAAPAAPSVLEPAEVPTRVGDALDVGVEAPATGVAAVRPVQAEAAPLRKPKAAQRERVAPRAAAARAPGARAVPAVAQRAPAAPPARAPGVPAVRPRATSPTAQSGQLGEELALLSEVRSSVQNGAPARALELLTRYRTRFGRPILGMEADALKVDALCKSGRRDAARASARAFQNDWPGSPLERRVSAACP
jgi:hypothetical protein